MWKSLVAAGILLSAFALPAVTANAAPPYKQPPHILPVPGPYPSPYPGNPGRGYRPPPFFAPARAVSTFRGPVLADNVSGLTLYTSAFDPPGRSACFGACLLAWRVFPATPGVRPFGPWSTINRFDGVVQWAYKGKPLYFSVQDRRPGDVRGDVLGIDGWRPARP